MSPQTTSMTALSSSSFPSIDLVPKRETKALEFVEKYPNYDGKDVLIGILDTGIDPGASGLRFMADGTTPKLVDIIDCTGSGDVDISTERGVTLIEGKDNGEGAESSEEAYYQVESLTGRKIKLNKSWWKGNDKDDEDKSETTAASAAALPKVKLGIKRAYELFPDSVVNRVKSYRKQEFDKERNKYIADLRQKLSDWQQSYQDKKPTPEQVQKKDDLQARMDALTDKEWDDDPGLILDCIVFHDGEDYRAVICTGETTDMRDVSPLAAYSKDRQYGTISTVDQYNYGVQFYDDAKVLSIVGDCTPHGTHVAAIAAGAEGDRSGVAPGAQLVGIKIGDSRMGSMETGMSLCRGIMTAIRLGCDVINLSYGEGSQLPNAGRVIQFAEELVWRHNIIFVSAIGNNGPALSTVNAPGGLSSCIFGVAAYISPDMMKAQYSLRSNTDGVNAEDDGDDDDGRGDDDNNSSSLVGTTYTWSSVGPTPDGNNGVRVCAPGGAITSVSNWTMQKSMLMNGTSMSSPHACGCVALLVSACKAENIPISPNRILRAVENTAKTMPNLSSLQQGSGMIQVEDALQHLQTTKQYESEDIYFDVCLDHRAGNPRGIYLRQKDECSTKQSFTVRVSPKFRRVEPVDEKEQKARIAFEMTFQLKSTASWVSVPDHFMLMNCGRAFKINVDPTNLSAGFHTATLNAYDSEHPERGTIWTLPITVVKPMEAKSLIEVKSLELEATEIKRFFVQPPVGSTWMDVTISDATPPSVEGSSKLFVLHTVQLIPHAAYRDYETKKYLNLLPRQTVVSSISVEAGVTCEIALGRYWSTAGPTTVDVKIEFRGVRPVPTALMMNSGSAFCTVRLHSELKDELILPSAKFSKWKTPIRPKSEGVIKPLGERDIQPWNDKRMYQLLLSYEFTQDEKGAFTPRAPALQQVLYESTYESQLMVVYDGDKRRLGCCDAYPSAITAPKGVVVIKMHVRHDDPSMLEKLKDMTIWIERKLEKEISLSPYSTREDLLVGGKRTLRKRTLRKGSCATVFFPEPSSSKIPSSCKPGDILMGSTSYASGEASLPGDGKRPSGYPIMFTVGPKMDKSSSSSSNSEGEVAEPKDERTAEERMSEAIRDLKVSHLEKLTSTEKENGKFEELYSEIWKQYPSYVPLLMTNLKYLDGLRKNRKSNTTTTTAATAAAGAGSGNSSTGTGTSMLKLLQQIVDAADKVIGQISEDELALHFGKKIDKEKPEMMKRNKELEKKKSHLIDALTRKSFAYSDMIYETATTTTKTTTSSATTKTDDGDGNTETSSDDKTASAAAAAATTTTDTTDAKAKFMKTLDKLKSWIDIDANGKHATLAIERDIHLQRYGMALKRINKLLSKATTSSASGGSGGGGGGKDSGGVRSLSKSDLLEKRSKIFMQLNYTALVTRDQTMKFVATPKDYQLF